MRTVKKCGCSGVVIEIPASEHMIKNAYGWTFDRAMKSSIDATRAAAGPTLDRASYTVLARQSMNIAPFTYRAIAPELFQQIAAQVLPPGPGPQTGRPNSSVFPRTEQ